LVETDNLEEFRVAAEAEEYYKSVGKDVPAQYQGAQERYSVAKARAEANETARQERVRLEEKHRLADHFFAAADLHSQISAQYIEAARDV
jgi:hypothetical protein